MNRFYCYSDIPFAGRPAQPMPTLLRLLPFGPDRVYKEHVYTDLPQIL